MLVTLLRENACGLPTTPDAAELPMGENSSELGANRPGDGDTGPKLLLTVLCRAGLAYLSRMDCMWRDGAMEPEPAAVSVGESVEKGTYRAIGGRSLMSARGSAHTGQARGTSNEGRCRLSLSSRCLLCAVRVSVIALRRVMRGA